MAVGFKKSDDPNVFCISRNVYSNLWTKMWFAASACLKPFAGKIRGMWRLSELCRITGNPMVWLDYERGRENFNSPSTRRLLDLTPEVPNIVHCHNLHGGGGYFDLRVLPWLSNRVPVILNLHDAWLLSGHCAHSFGCTRWKTGCGKCPYPITYPVVKRDATAYNWRRKKDIYRQSRLYITTPSQWLMNKVRLSMLQGIKYRVIPNGIDLNLFSPGSKEEARKVLGIPEKTTVVLMIAHNEYKDYQTMEQALGKVQPENGRKLVFLCVGKKGKDKTVGSGIMSYQGFEHDSGRMVYYYRASDVFIHAAKDEVFGKTITEAMACGLPTVATEVGGIPEQIDDGKNGILVPARDSERMASAVNRLLRDSGLRSTISEQGILKAREKFSLEHQAEEFLAWYQEIIEDWKSRKS